MTEKSEVLTPRLFDPQAAELFDRTTADLLERILSSGRWFDIIKYQTTLESDVERDRANFLGPLFDTLYEMNLAGVPPDQRSELWQKVEFTWQLALDLYIAAKVSVLTGKHFVPDATAINKAIRKICEIAAISINEFNLSKGNPERVKGQEILDSMNPTYKHMLFQAGYFLAATHLYPGVAFDQDEGTSSLVENDTLGEEMFFQDMVEIATKSGIIDAILYPSTRNAADVLDTYKELCISSFINDLGPVLLPIVGKESAGQETFWKSVQYLSRSIDVVYDLGIGVNRAIRFSVPPEGWQWQVELRFIDGSSKTVVVTIKDPIDFTNPSLKWWEEVERLARESAHWTGEVVAVGVPTLPSNIRDGTTADGKFQSWDEYLNSRDPDNSDFDGLALMLNLHNYQQGAYNEAISATKSSGPYSIKDFSKEEIEQLRLSLVGTLISSNKDFLEMFRDPRTALGLNADSAFWSAFIMWAIPENVKSLVFAAQNFLRPALVSEALGSAPVSVYEAERLENLIRSASREGVRFAINRNRALLYTAPGLPSPAEPNGIVMLAELLPRMALAAFFAYLMGSHLYQTIRMSKPLNDLLFHFKISDETNALIDNFLQEASEKTYESFQDFREDFLRSAQTASAGVRLATMDLIDRYAARYLEESAKTIPELVPVTAPSRATINLRAGGGTAVNDTAIDLVISKINLMREPRIEEVVTILYQEYDVTVALLRPGLESTAGTIPVPGLPYGTIEIRPGTSLPGTPTTAVTKRSEFTREQCRVAAEVAWDRAVQSIRSYLVDLALKQTSTCYIDAGQLENWISNLQYSPMDDNSTRIGPLSLVGLAIAAREILRGKINPTIEPYSSAETQKQAVDEMNEKGFWRTLLARWSALWTKGSSFDEKQYQEDAIRKWADDFIRLSAVEYVASFAGYLQAAYRLPISGTSIDTLMMLMPDANNYFDKSMVLEKSLERIFDSKTMDLVKTVSPGLLTLAENSVPNILTAACYYAVFKPGGGTGQSAIDSFIASLGLGQRSLDELKRMDWNSIRLQLWSELRTLLMPVEQSIKKITEDLARRVPVPQKPYYVGDRYRDGVIVGFDSYNLYVNFPDGTTKSIPLEEVK